MDGDTDLQGIVDSAWHHAIISDALYSTFLKSCNFSMEILSPECEAAWVEFGALYNLIDIYSLYTPYCDLGYPALNASSSSVQTRRIDARVSILFLFSHCAPMNMHCCILTKRCD
jgi:serine carboxypeptidase-like clade 2